MEFVTRRSALVGVFAGMLSAGAATGTVLTFDLGHEGQAPDGITMNTHQGYGDKVGGQVQPPGYMYGVAGGPTPHIQVMYGPGLHFAWSTPRNPGVGHQYGDLSNVVFRDKYTTGPNQNSLLEIILFSDDPTKEVALHSFDVAVLLGESLPIRSIQVVDNAQTVLFRRDNVLVPGTQPATHLTFDEDDYPNGLPIRAPILQIRLDLSSILTKIDRFAIDNIVLSEVEFIPTPGLAGTFLVGAGLFAVRRRRT